MDDGGRGAALLRARADIRRRWRSLVVLGLLAGLTAGLSMAALAGARRTDTAFARLREVTNAADAVVFPGQVGILRAEWAELEGQPEVKAVAVWNLLFGDIEGEPGGLLFAAHDGTFLGEVGRPVVTEGRMFDPAASDEVVVSEGAQAFAPVGTTFRIKTFAPDQAAMPGEVPRGPEVTMTVVGAVRGVNQFLFTDQVLVSPGFRARYADDVLLVENADVQLVGGAADIPALQRDVTELIAEGTPLLDLHAVSRRVDTTLSVERTALVLLGIVVALAGGLLVAQALIRSVSNLDAEVLLLRGIGMTRRDMVLSSVLAHSLTGLVTLVAAAVAMVVASRFFPVGLGRRVDPDVGTHADRIILGPGLLLAGLLVVGGVVLAANRRVTKAGRVVHARRSSIVALIRGRAPVAIGLGTTMAFERARGRASAAVRPALAGAIVGVLGVVATLTIDQGIDDSLANPERAGVVWDATLALEQGAFDGSQVRPELVDEVLAAAPSGSTAVVIDRQVLDVDAVGVPTFALRQPTGEDPIRLVITEGRAPQAVGEAAIGPETARILDADVGDRVRFEGEEMTVVGRALFPTDVHSEFDEGLWITPEQMDSVVTGSDPESLTGTQTIALRFPKDIDAERAVAALAEALGPPIADVAPVDVPAELSNLRNVRSLPVLLAWFLALLAVAAVSHVLVTSAQRRRGEFAVLRALGVTRRGTRLVLSSHSTAIGLVGLFFGVPLGIAAGRTGWRWIAQQVPLEDVTPVALLAVLVLIPVTVLVVNALALWPGHRVAQIRPADALRAE